MLPRVALKIVGMNFFQELYSKYIKPGQVLSNADLQKILDENRAFLDAKYRALDDEVSYEFDKARFIPEVASVNIAIPIVSTQLQYKLNGYDVLQDTMLVDLIVPVSNSLTLAPDATTLVPYAGIAGAYLSLFNTRQQLVRDTEPLLNYVRDGSYWPRKGEFKQTRIDWKNSYISFPNTTIPTTYNGNTLLLVARYIDMKRYEK